MADDSTPIPRRKPYDARRIWRTRPDALAADVRAWWETMSQHPDLLRDLRAARAWLEIQPDRDEAATWSRITLWLKARYPRLWYYTAVDEATVYTLITTSILP